jgi:DNA-directed RNA polymerase specialized sigma24 family protein
MPGATLREEAGGALPVPPRVILTHFRSPGAIIAIAEAVLCLIDRLHVPVTLRPVTRLPDRDPRSIGQPSDLLLTDSPARGAAPPTGSAPDLGEGGLAGPRHRWPTLPVFLASKDALAAPPRRCNGAAVDLQRFALPRGGPSDVALVLAGRVIPEFPSDFVSSLPGPLRPEERLVLARGVLDPNAAASLDMIASASQFSATALRRSLGRAGVDDSDILAAIRIYGVFHWNEVGGIDLAGAFTRFHFGTRRMFDRACEGAFGARGTAIRRRGGTAWLARRIRDRWGSDARAARGGWLGEGHGPQSVYTDEGFDPIPDRAVARLLADRRRAAMGGARSLGVPPDIAEDAAGHVMVRLFERVRRDEDSLGKLLQDTFTRQYAWRSGRNYAADQRSRKSEVHFPDLGEAMNGAGAGGRFRMIDPAPMGNARWIVPRSALRARLGPLLRPLSEPGYTVLWLRRGGGFGRSEVARVLGCTSNAVKLQERRALKAARRSIGSEGA